MISALKTSLWKQFGAAIDMLENASRLIQTGQWHANKKLFYNAYHCLVSLDYYLTIPPSGFSAVLPFTFTTPDNIPADGVDDLVPNRIYSKEELLDYVKSCRDKCRNIIAGLTKESTEGRWMEVPDHIASRSTMNYSVLEILLYNMRHVQHHAAQLNLLLRQSINNAPGWVSSAKDHLY
jgi:hypothetical protein